MAAIYPLLALREGFDGEQFVNRPLTETDEFDVPLVTFARFGDQGQVKCTTWAALQKRGHKIDNIERKGMKDLVERGERPGWEPMNVNHEGQEVTILMRQGDVVTASDILDPEMMNIAANYFSSEEVFVGIPCQTTMIASNQGEYIHAAVMEHYNAAPANGLIALSPLVYCVKDGKIIGIAAFDGPAPAAQAPAPPQAAQPPPQQAAQQPAGGDVSPIPRAAPQIFSYEGSNAFWLTLPCNGYEALYQAIQTELQEYGPRLPNWEGFQGRVVFHIEPGSVRLTMEERKIFDQLSTTLTQQAMQNGWKSPYGDPVSVEILLPPPGQDTGKVKKEKPPQGAADTPAAAGAQTAEKRPRKTKGKGKKSRKLRTGTRNALAADAAAATEESPTASGTRRKSRQLKRKTRSGHTSTSLRRTTTGATGTAGDLDLGEGPLTPQMLMQQMPHKLNLAIWGFRLWYILFGLSFFVIGILIMAGMAAFGQMAKGAIDEQGGAITVEQKSDGQIVAPQPPGELPATPAPPAPANQPPAPVTEGPPNSPPVPVGPGQPREITSDEAAAKATGAGVVMGLFFIIPAILVFVIYEFLLILGLKKLKGWARGLGILTSGIMCLLILPLPFGAMALLGLTNGDTAHLFAEAKNLRRMRRMK